MTAPKKLDCILVPVDFNEHSRAAFQQAVAFARKLDASIILLHVWEAPHHVAPNVMLTLPGWNALTLEQFGHSRALEVARAFLKSIDHGRVKVQIKIETGAPAASILRTANEERCSLIVMGTRGRGPIGRLFLGSVARSVASQASIPVMTVRAPELAVTQPEPATHAA